MIGNLLQNALDAAESQVRVTTRCEADRVVLQVTDDGPGIPQELRDKIFSPFFSTKQPGKGMGLGLAIARQVVSRAGGTIAAYAAAPTGTTFEVRVPRR